MANISAIKLPDNTTYNIKAGAIPYGEVDSTSTSTAYTATVPGINELKNGTIMLLRNGTVTSASGFKININGLGAKPVYNNLATGNTHTPTNPTRDTTIFNINYTMLFIYDEELVSGGAWICYRGYDANTNTIGYQLRGNNGTRPASDKGYRYRLWLSSLDNQNWVPINTSTATDASTSRSLNSRVIDPFGEIVYYAYNGTTNAAANLTATNIWQQYTLTIGYSYVKSLTARDPVYLKCEPKTTGGAVMKDIVQALPSTADGFIYIYLGIAYSATAMELRFYHPVYYHDGTGIRAWTGYTETDPIFTASPAHGITTNDITNWNNKSDFSGSYNDLTDKPTIPVLPSNIVNTVTTTAGAHTTITNKTGNVSFNVPTKTSHLTNDGDGTSAFARMSDIGGLGGGTITKVKTTAGAHTVIDVSSGDAEFNVPTKTSHLTNDSGFITSADLPEGPLIGDTDEISPAEVLAALQAGRDVYITYPHATYGNIVATSFNSSAGFGVIASNMIGLYSDEFSKTHYMLFELLGQLTGGWTCYTTFLASESDIPSVPTTALSSTTGITATTTATKTTLGTAGSVIGVQSTTTTASKVTLSGSNSFSASVSNHVLSFSHGAQTVSASDVTVPIKDTGATSIPNVSIASATVTITDPGHTHQLSN